MLRRLSLVALGLSLYCSIGNCVIISGTLGLGSSTTSNETSYSEGPFVQAYTVENQYSSKFRYGVEHVRSLASSFSTSISFSGVMARYYMNTSPAPYFKAGELKGSSYSFRDIGYYIGSGFGFSQSSRLPDKDGLSSNAAGLYLSPRAGTDFQLNSRFGVRGEFLVVQSLLGKGQTNSISLGIGVYFFL